MKQQDLTLSVAGPSKWLWVDPRRYTDQSIQVSITITPGATLAYKLEYTIDNNTKERWNNASLSTAATTTTVTLVDHGLKAADSVVVFDSGYTNHSPDTGVEGTFQVATVTNKDVFTYTSTGAAGVIKSRLLSFNVIPHPTVTSAAIRDGSFETNTDGVDLPRPVTGVRLFLTSLTSGQAKLTLLQNA